MRSRTENFSQALHKDDLSSLLSPHDNFAKRNPTLGHRGVRRGGRVDPPRQNPRQFRQLSTFECEKESMRLGFTGARHGGWERGGLVEQGRGKGGGKDGLLCVDKNDATDLLWSPGPWSLESRNTLFPQGVSPLTERVCGMENREGGGGGQEGLALVLYPSSHGV